jgi:D-alanyl-D-alanine carboxypeptidase/D-alanyl-D-alanine-endopeptidase (penicillin-binding protein 4)
MPAGDTRSPSSATPAAVATVGQAATGAQPEQGPDTTKDQGKRRRRDRDENQDHAETKAEDKTKDRHRADEAQDPPDDGAQRPAKRGMLGRVGHALRLRDRTGRSWLAVGLVAVLILGLASGGVLAGPKLARTLGLRGAEHDFQPKAPLLRLGPLASDAPTPSSSGISAALAKPAAAKGLGTLTGVVLDPTTGQQLWGRDPDQPMPPGSTNKILTTAAVLLTLDPTTRLTTKVLAGPAPDSVVLVGGGDPTLSSLPPGSDSVYPGAAKLASLADEVKAAHPGPIRSVVIDTGMFTGDGMAPGWDRSDIQGGNFTPIGSLILDGGRGKPDELDPPRSATPATDAGKALAQLLGADSSAVTVGNAAPNAAELGRVSSPPLSDLVETTLRISDNVLAEALARHLAIAKGDAPSFSGAATAVRDTLAANGFNVDGARTVDGSGLSTQDLVPAKVLGQIMSVAAGPAGDPRADKLRPLLAGLPVAGGDGTLDNRFDTGASAEGKGWVRAKTGTLTGVSALTGTVTDEDGRLLTFALMSNGASPADSRPLLDTLAATLRGCGCR